MSLIPMRAIDVPFLIVFFFYNGVSEYKHYAYFQYSKVITIGYSLQRTNVEVQKGVQGCIWAKF
jgi:hypothetical protein